MLFSYHKRLQFGMLEEREQKKNDKYSYENSEDYELYTEHSQMACN